MSVVANESIRIRLWRGYDDPGLPVGMYFAQNAVTGNASGGNAVVIFIFKGEGDPISGRFFNIEQVNFFIGASVSSTICSLTATNFETLGPVGLVNRQWRFEVEQNGNSVSPMNEQAGFPMPLFLGSAAPLASLATQVEFATNNIDITSFVATIQGYIWEARSIQAEGGLRRPVDSLYGGGRG